MKTKMVTVKELQDDARWADEDLQSAETLILDLQVLVDAERIPGEQYRQELETRLNALDACVERARDFLEPREEDEPDLRITTDELPMLKEEVPKRCFSNPGPPWARCTRDFGHEGACAHPLLADLDD